MAKENTHHWISVFKAKTKCIFVIVGSNGNEEEEKKNTKSQINKSQWAFSDDFLKLKLKRTLIAYSKMQMTMRT